MSSSSSTTFSRIPIFHGLCVIRHSKDTDNWTESALRFNNSSVSFYKYEFVPDHAIPSLFGYIIVVMILTVLPSPYSQSTTFDDELSLRRFSSSYHSPRTTSLIPNWCRIRGSNNLLLHQSFCLMQSLFDCFFVDRLDKKFRDHHQYTALL